MGHGTVPTVGRDDPARRSPAAVIVPGYCDVMPYGIVLYCVLRRKVMLRPPDAVMRCLPHVP